MRPKANKTKPKSRAPFNSPPMLRPNAAGIDIGAREIYVAVPRERDPVSYTHLTLPTILRV